MRRIAILFIFAPLALIVGIYAAPKAMPDYQAACQSGTPYFVTAAYRAQSSSDKAPELNAPSVILFQDTPQDRVHYELASFRQTGTVWGLAFRKSEGAVYASTYHKRGLPYGPLGAGGIYRIDLATGDVKPFITVPDTSDLRRAAQMTDGTRDYDKNGGRLVGKTSLGDMDLSDDESMLFVMNLDNRKIYRFEMPSGKLIDSFANGAVAEPWGQVGSRPFALASWAGKLYHGLVNARGSGNSLEAKIYQSEYDGSNMKEVASVPLGYRRDGVRLKTVNGGSTKWGPWSDSLERIVEGQRAALHDPQPMLTDIQFLESGKAVSLSIRDRHTDMVTQWIDEVKVVVSVTWEHGDRAPPQPTKSIDTNIISEQALGFGDVLRGVPATDGSGTYTFLTDPEELDDSNELSHGEAAMGALSCVKGTDIIGATIYGVNKARTDKIIGEEGVHWYDLMTTNKTGHEAVGVPGSFLPYSQLLNFFKNANADTFGEVRSVFQTEWFRDVASLGDLETLCDPCTFFVDVPTPFPVVTLPPPTKPPTDTPVIPTPTPTDTPTPTPTDTPTPTPTDTPTPTPTPTPGPIYLPIIISEVCETENVYADVVMVIDMSTSMNRSSVEGVPVKKLTAVLDAAAAFVERMKFTPNNKGQHDQVAVVGFNDLTWVELPLSNDKAKILKALTDLPKKQGQGTRIDLGFEAGAQALPANLRLPGNTPTMILLTDGLPNRVPFGPGGSQEQTVIAAAQKVKDLGIRVYTIGVGSPDAPDLIDKVDPELLKACATTPSMSFVRPDASQLTNVYTEIAYSFACPVDSLWGRR